MAHSKDIALRKARTKGYWRWRCRCERLGLDWTDREVRRAYAANPRTGRFRNKGLYWWLHPDENKGGA